MTTHNGAPRAPRRAEAGGASSGQSAPVLPADLVDLGFKLIVRVPDRMFAVSWSWGCTGTKATLPEVVREARSIASYCGWANEKGLR